jgi:hypothetical protein
MISHNGDDSAAARAHGDGASPADQAAFQKHMTGKLQTGSTQDASGDVAELERDADVLGEGFVPCECVSDLTGKLLAACLWTQLVG